MQTTQDLHDTGAFYFFLLAFAYAIAMYMFKNTYLAEWALLFMRVFDMPLLLVSLIYGGTSLILQINQGHEVQSSPWNMIILAASVLLFALGVFINFAFPSIF